ncbi:MAG TPA: NAD(P)/FAD-dependent oxidoreductase [Alphaproteobacteria bacterium]|nr:NAD(P)/FAD-dependent oxidoreductase [Alphaproteobacteria bacterium]
MSADSPRSDVAVIGAGPVGLFTVFECGMLKMSCQVVDALDSVGGQCVALYPEKPIYDIPGHPRIAAMELIEKLSEQAAPFKPVYHLGQRVESLTQAGDDWELGLSAGGRLRARAVVIAAGVGAFGPNRPPLARLAEFEGKSVHYLVKRRDDFKGKRVVIAGGGDSAVDWALSLAGHAAQVMVVHRRDKFRAAPESVRQMKELVAAGKIEMVIPFQLEALEGKDGNLDAVIVKDLDNHTRRLEADSLLAFFGLAMNLGPIATWGLNLDENHIKVDPATFATSVPGLFAVGDIARYPGKLKLILSGFAEAAAAAHAIHPLVHPGEVLHFQYSTTQGVPSS